MISLKICKYLLDEYTTDEIRSFVHNFPKNRILQKHITMEITILENLIFLASKKPITTIKVESILYDKFLEPME